MPESNFQIAKEKLREKSPLNDYDMDYLLPYLMEQRDDLSIQDYMFYVFPLIEDERIAQMYYIDTAKLLTNCPKEFLDFVKMKARNNDIIRKNYRKVIIETNRMIRHRDN